jgi:hypothetical protein
VLLVFHDSDATLPCLLFLGCTQTLSTPSLWRNLAIGVGACSAGVVSKDIISPAKNLSVRRLHVNL